MARTIWVDEWCDVEPDGSMLIVTFNSGGEQYILRQKRHVGLAGNELFRRRYCEIERSERKARVVPIGKR